MRRKSNSLGPNRSVRTSSCGANTDRNLKCPQLHDVPAIAVFLDALRAIGLTLGLRSSDGRVGQTFFGAQAFSRVIVALLAAASVYRRASRRSWRAGRSSGLPRR